MLKLLILPLTKTEPSEMLEIFVHILSVSHWRKHDLDIRKSLRPPHMSRSPA
jgi:hypothetical protein